MADLTAESLRSVLRYDAETGVFTWLSGRCKGAEAGTVDARGYIRIGIARRIYKAHRLAWLYVHGAWPTNEIDHIDGDHGNNRLANLRDVPRQVNQQNLRRPHKRGRSGILGVSLHKQSGKWRARVWVNGRNKSLGLFERAEEAKASYVAAKRQEHEGSTL